MLEMRGVSSCEYVRGSRINKEQGRGRDGEMGVRSVTCSVVVILGLKREARRADHV